MILKTKSFTPPIQQVICERATEKPFSNEYDALEEPGTYLCRQCGIALFRAETKFPSGCGWPSFDQPIPNAVLEKSDLDGMRTEIVCARCNGHLGHVFKGEGLTPLNTRHCVNSVSLDFVNDLTVKDTEEAIFAAGCFWGVEYYFKKMAGVIKTEVGYTGGYSTEPTYEDVCGHDTGHFEAIRVVYDSQKTNFETICRYFFEIHDPTQANGQGPDLGPQYLSVVFYYDEEQKATTESLIEILTEKGFQVSTKILPVSVFWPAEHYHQNYYQKTRHEPYCHRYTKRF